MPFFGHWDEQSAYSAPGVVRGRMWYLRRTQTSGPAQISFAYGLSTDIPLAADWNGDGIDTPAVVRGHTWYIRNSNTPGSANVSFTFNEPGIPTVFFGLTAGDPARPATFDNGTWYVRNANGTVATTHFGQAGDIPLGGGYYIDAPDCTSPTLALVRGNVWHVSGGGVVPDQAYGFGHAGDRFLAQHY